MGAHEAKAKHSLQS